MDAAGARAGHPRVRLAPAPEAWLDDLAPDEKVWNGADRNGAGRTVPAATVARPGTVQPGTVLPDHPPSRIAPTPMTSPRRAAPTGTPPRDRCSRPSAGLPASPGD